MTTFTARLMTSIRTARAVATVIGSAFNAAALILVVVLITPSTVRDECLT